MKFEAELMRPAFPVIVQQKHTEWVTHTQLRSALQARAKQGRQSPSHVRVRCIMMVMQMVTCSKWNCECAQALHSQHRHFSNMSGSAGLGLGSSAKDRHQKCGQCTPYSTK